MSVSIDLGVVGGGVAGGALAYRTASKVADAGFTQVVAKGLGSQVGGAIGSYVIPHMPDTITAGIGVEVAERFHVPGGAIGAVMRDGAAGLVGSKAGDVPPLVAKGIRELAELRPSLQPAAEVVARAAEGAPRAMGAIAGAGVGVEAARRGLAFAPKVALLGGVAAGALMGAAFLNQHLVIGD